MASARHRPQRRALLAGLYREPKHFAVGPDDRSYLVQSGWTPEFSSSVWTETNAGCHAPAWLLEAEHCRNTTVRAAAVDASGVLHMTGSEEVIGGDYRLVHWAVGPTDVVRTELASLPDAEIHYFDHSLAIAASGEIHLCLDTEGPTPAAIYGHGHDGDDWTMIPIEDPDSELPNASDQNFCKVALGADEVPWFIWNGGDGGEANPFRVASFAAGELNYEVIDDGAYEPGAQLTVDAMGRPWVVYTAFSANPDSFKLAHRSGDEWIIEIVTPP